MGTHGVQAQARLPETLSLKDNQTLTYTVNSQWCLCWAPRSCLNHIPFPEQPPASCIATREHRLALYKKPKWYSLKIWVQGSWACPYPEIEHVEDLEAPIQT